MSGQDDEDDKMVSGFDKKALSVLFAALCLFCSAETPACDSDASMSFEVTSFTSGVMQTRKYQLRIPAAHLKASRLWKPGRDPIPLSPNDAYAALQSWFEKHRVDSPEFEVSRISLHGCMDETGFRFYIFDLKPQDRFAVLFDSTVVAARKIEP